MPAIIELRLDLAERPTVYPARLHGAACALLEPTTVPHDSNHKPFSVWPLIGEGRSARWRLGWLAATPAVASFTRVTFGRTDHNVVKHRVDEVSFADLAGTRPCRRARLEVISPLYFSRNGRDHPLPDPVLMMRSALDRWDHHAPPALTVPEQCRRDLLSSVYLAEMDGATIAGAVGATTFQTGFVGAVELTLTRAADDTTEAVFAAMLRFTDIAGIGAQTTHGFGAVHIPTTTRNRSSSNGNETPRSSQDHHHSSATSTPPDDPTQTITEDHPERAPRSPRHPP